MNLNAVTQNNVPNPFLPSAEKRNSPRLNMPEGCINQQIKFTASDLQESLYPQSIYHQILRLHKSLTSHFPFKIDRMGNKKS